MADDGMDDGVQGDGGGSTPTPAPSNPQQGGGGGDDMAAARQIMAQANQSPLARGPQTAQQGGFFRSLLGTLMKGAGVGLEAGLSTPIGPSGFQNSGAKALADPRINKQAQEQQLTAKQMQQLQLAQTQLNMLHVYHMMANEDDQHKELRYNDVRDYVRKMDEEGQYEWVGQSEDRATLVQKANEMRKQLTAAGDNDEANSIQVVPRPESTYDTPRWGIVKSLRDPVKGGFTTTISGNPERGIPDQTFTAQKGQNNVDAQYYYNLKTQAQNVAASKNANPANPTSALTENELRSDLTRQGFKVPTNLANIWSVYTGQDSIKDALSDKPGKGELSRTDALNFIKNFDPTFNPEIADRVGGYNKELSKAETTYAMEGGKNADQAVADAKRIAADPKTPQALKTRAATLEKAAQVVADKWHQEQNEKGGDKAEKFLQTQITEAHAKLQTAMQTDEGKVMDLQSSIDDLKTGGGEADGVAAISALRGLVGGGGVRITNAELDTIAKTRGWTGSLSVMLNNLTNPSEYAKLSTVQRTQLADILTRAYDVIQKRDAAHRDADHKILNAGSMQDLRAAQDELTNKLRIPALGQRMMFPDGKVRLVSPEKMKAALDARARVAKPGE